MTPNLETLSAEIVTKIRSSLEDSTLNQAEMVRNMINEVCQLAFSEGRILGRNETMDWVSQECRRSTERLTKIQDFNDKGATMDEVAHFGTSGFWVTPSQPGT